MAKIAMGKSRTDSKPYLTIVEGSWKTLVLKAYSADPDAKYARWFCKVITPMTGSYGDMGDTYIAEIPGQIVQRDPEVPDSALPRRFVDRPGSPTVRPATDPFRWGRS